MPPVTIYTTSLCPYCLRAKTLLKSKGVAFEEIDVGYDDVARRRMVARALGRRSVPQIFVGATHVGGSDDLHALEAQGGLDRLLATA